jgi:HPt (histidine-containing phosphotransfer) domain-containing protein
VGGMTVSQLNQGEQQSGVFSRQRFLDYCMGRAELAERLITIFTEGLPKDLLDIQGAVEDWDIPRIAKLSHRLKGASASMCAERLSSAAATLERSARASDTDQIAAGWLVVEREIRALLEALRHP